jgi:hypothetical protein
VTSDPRAFFAIDQGAATSSAALVGRVGDRWRLLGSQAMPAGIPIDAILERLAGRVIAADSATAEAIDARGLGTPPEWPRLVARSAPPPRLSVLAATESTRRRLEHAASVAGWRTGGASLETTDLLGLVRGGLTHGSDVVVAGTEDPPTRAERAAIGSLAAVVEAIADRRPEATIVLSGALALLVPDPDRDAARQAAATVRPRTIDGPTRIYAPPPQIGDPRDPLVELLARFRTRQDDAMAGVARTTASLAAVMDRRIETVAIGLDTATRVTAWPTSDEEGEAASKEPGVSALDGVAWLQRVVATAGFVPENLDDEAVDGVLAWTTGSLDRIRLRDRLHELRFAPWGHPDGDGATLRLACGRAALARLVAETGQFEAHPAPDLVICSGGVFAPAPGPAVALALADVLRRPAACQFAFDHARLMGPIGTIPEEQERRLLLADIADDMLAPLGSVVSPQGLRAGRSAGRVVIHGGTGSTELDLVPGGLQLVDLPPGQMATAEFEFRDPVVLGARGRHFAVEVGGGLGGLLIDLRDVPLRLPDRLEHRRELLAAWQGALWAGGEG